LACFASAIALLGASSAPAATYYIATDGCDGASYTGSESLPFATFAHAFQKMRGGDTLRVKPGRYTQTVKDPPSGTATAYTTVQAVTNGTVEIDGSHHIKLIRCAFYDAPDRGNHSVLNIGPEASDVLVEECWAWGTGRYKILNYQSERVIFRRCVSRHDFYDIHGIEPDNQTAPFSMYDSTNFLMQNCIALDSGNENSDLTGWLYGGLWSENNDGRNNSGKVQGSIFLNLDGLSAINDPKIIGTRLIENTIVWHSRGGYNSDALNPAQGATTEV
jgi:hypothetical protein